MRVPTLIFAASSLCCAAAAMARPADAPVKAPDHAGVIQARQAAFKLSLSAFLAIKVGTARGDDAHLYRLPAGALAAWGKAIPTMFPPGSDGAGSNALPTVWSDRAGFEAAAANMSAAAAKLAELSQAGDAAGVSAQFAELGKACGDCHTKYRKPEEKH